MNNPITSRKNDHLELCAEGDVRFHEKTTLFEEVEILHESLPSISLAAVDPAVEILGRKLSAPLLISAMSGGIPKANAMNQTLAETARNRGLGLGLGSQRPLLEGGDRWPSLRQGPEDPLLILGNIGLVQARREETSRLSDLVSAVGADALCVHLNPAQEWFQAEGDLDFGRGLETLARLIQELPVPLMVKETGCGISTATARRLKGA
ncbi:MAG: beta/alpha barrel domain-containing protein, partial [Planctomycetota bacterium]